MMSRRGNFIAAALVVLIVTARYVGISSAARQDFNVTTEKEPEDKTVVFRNLTMRNGSSENCTIFTVTNSSKLGENATSDSQGCLQEKSFTLEKYVSTDSLVWVFVAISLGIWSVVANSLPLAAIIKKEQLHKPVYILMANLAASDVLTGITFTFGASMTFFVSQAEIIPSNVVLRFRLTSVLLSGLSSAYGLMALTAERYWFIVHGMSYINSVTNDKCKVAIVIVWVWSVLLAMLSNISDCAGRFDETCIPLGGGLSKSYVMAAVVFVFIPTVAIVLLNIGIFWCLWKHINAIAAQEAAVGAQRSTSRKSAITIVIITVVFLVGWLPFFVNMALLNTDMVSLYKTMVFVILNSAINPVIYAFRLRDVRQGVARLFIRGKNGNLAAN